MRTATKAIDASSANASDLAVPGAVIEMEMVSQPVDLTTVLDGIKKAGMQRINTPKSVQHQVRAGPQMTRGRIAQLEGASAVLYLRHCKDTGFESQGLCQISDDDYARLRKAADAWYEDYCQTRAPAGGNGERTPLPNGTILHLVTANDTIQGLAIKYDTTVKRIRELNHLPQGREIFERKELVVPIGHSNGKGMPFVTNPPVEEFRQVARYAAEREFCKATGCGEDEGWCYLEFNEYNVPKAIKDYKEDAEWDSQFDDSFDRAKPQTLEEFIASRRPKGNMTKTLSI